MNFFEVLRVGYKNLILTASVQSRAQSSSVGNSSDGPTIMCESSSCWGSGESLKSLTHQGVCYFVDSVVLVLGWVAVK